MVEAIRFGTEALVMAGYNAHVAEALAENEHTVETAKLLCADEVFNLFLEWNGIIGFDIKIRDALDNARNMDAL